MYDFIRTYQLDIMLFLCETCGIITFLLALTRFLPRRRKAILIQMELIAFFLLFFDRLAYIYAADPGKTGYVMVRVSNFAVFFLTSYVVLGYSIFLMDWLQNEGEMKGGLKRLRLVAFASVGGMIMAVIAAFVNLFYYFDETNRYHRGRFFLISYIIPVICPIICLTVVLQYRKKFTKLVYAAMLIYIILPLISGVIQIFTYGISIVNMAMVIVSVMMYILTYLDINNTVEHAHEIEIQNMQAMRKNVQKMFDRTIMSVVSELEEKERLDKGYAALSADYSKKIAEKCERDEEFCKKAYYVTLFNAIDLHGVIDKVIDIKEDEAKDIQRIAEVSCDYVHMTTNGEDHNAIPDYLVREMFVREAGEKYDLAFADLMVKIIDSQESGSSNELSFEGEIISCLEYRDHISNGIEITKREKRIRFVCNNNIALREISGAPSVVLFDSMDRRVHSDEKTISGYGYIEYGELWFDGHYVSTAARKMESIDKIQTEMTDTDDSNLGKGSYEIRAGRFEDHIRIELTGPEGSNEWIIALPDKTKNSYIGLTGENCEISDIKIENADEEIRADYIQRIVTETSYIDCLESDIKNVQIDRFRSAATEGIELSGHINILFHSMSLPSSNMIWHCPSVVIYYSKDGNVFGPDYREYDLIKLDGEDDGDKEYVTNRFKMKKKDEFPGWELWKEKNKVGLDYEVYVEKKGNRIKVKTSNLGIELENITTVLDGPEKVYVALTGDQVALTDIRLI